MRNRFTPSMRRGTLKLISRPISARDTFMYVSSCACVVQRCQRFHTLEFDDLALLHDDVGLVGAVQSQSLVLDWSRDLQPERDVLQSHLVSHALLIGALQ